MFWLIPYKLQDSSVALPGIHGHNVTLPTHLATVREGENRQIYRLTVS